MTLTRSARIVLVALFACTLAYPLVASAQSTATAASSATEQRAERAFAAAKKEPPALEAFLRRMPKGADLHVHLSGAVYAETFLREAAEDHLCVNTTTMKLAAAASMVNGAPFCAQQEAPAANAFTDQRLYDRMVDAFSLRGFVPSAGWSGHDQFFATFDRFDALGNQHAGEWLDEVVSRAAAQNEQYMEIMLTPPFDKAATLAAQLGWPQGAEHAVTPAQLAHLRDQLLAAGLKNEVADDVKEFHDAEADRLQREDCDAKDPIKPACAVQVRWIYQVLRGFPPQQVFAQTLLGFEVAGVDPAVVGINFVMPEDGYLSMRDYHLQMQMLDYLHAVYPRVHISLHAGELAPGLAPPAGLRFHVREAVELGHAERIGHGVNVMHEDDPDGLLKEMAGRHIMVEINLTSNDAILGVKAPNHPLPEYRAAHVPVALSTDDEGVSRIDLTHEYTRAALEFNLSYRDLKNMARSGLEHSFLPGESLWARRDDFTLMGHGCHPPEGAGEAPILCQQFLRSSERAAQQWELERRFHTFEAGLR